jgi:hypothetical protein
MAMTTKDPDVREMEDPEGQLEKTLIAEFLRDRGLDLHSLHALPEDQVKHLLTEASVYAAGKLAEIGARSHYVHDIHNKE